MSCREHIVDLGGNGFPELECVLSEGHDGPHKDLAYYVPYEKDNLVAGYRDYVIYWETVNEIKNESPIKKYAPENGERE